jgi:hypothetical protein
MTAAGCGDEHHAAGFEVQREEVGERERAETMAEWGGWVVRHGRGSVGGCRAADFRPPLDDLEAFGCDL